MISFRRLGSLSPQLLVRPLPAPFFRTSIGITRVR